ncbi:MAG: hypothetical protein HC888_02635 [Candidatus Competibacteraceae bacterium]|nr:hypothetical protein [Candidatus Competibacteraceae bacterium]
MIYRLVSGGIYHGVPALHIYLGVIELSIEECARELQRYKAKHKKENFLVMLELEGSTNAEEYLMLVRMLRDSGSIVVARVPYEELRSEHWAAHQVEVLCNENYPLQKVTSLIFSRELKRIDKFPSLHDSTLKYIFVDGEVGVEEQERLERLVLEAPDRVQLQYVPKWRVYA